jgi:hypothetical protein
VAIDMAASGADNPVQAVRILRALSRTQAVWAHQEVITHNT